MLKKFVVFILLTVLSSTIFPLIGVKGNNNTTRVQLDPSTITISEIGKTFSLNATIANVTGLCAWDFKLYYRNSILSCIDATEGPFLRTGGDAVWADNIDDSYNSTHGRVRFGCSLLGQVPGVNGSGVLATITFQAKGGGDTLLHFDDTQLYDCSEHPQLIEHEAIDGNVHVGIHDVAITNVVPSKAIIAQGYSANITITAENQGDLTETFNVTVYANTTIINQTEVYLTSGNSTTIALTWNTTGIAKGNYTISAYAWPVSGETDTTDNTCTDDNVLVTVPGDVDGNMKVDLDDLLILIDAFWGAPGKPNWNPNVDIDSNMKVDLDDLLILIDHFWEHW
jgi:hypothetical protein